MYFLDRGKSISHLILPRKKKFKTKNRKKQIVKGILRSDLIYHRSWISLKTKIIPAFFIVNSAIISSNMFGPSAKRSAGGTPKTNARKIRKHVTNANQDNLEFETIDQQTLERKYPSALNFYFHPPGYAIRLETMEVLAMERLRFLRTMEKFSNMKKDNDWVDAVKKDLNSSGLSAYYNLVERINTDWLQNRARDYISHFVLRLAYSRTEDLRRWFVSQEVDAFRYDNCFTSKERST